MAVNPASASSSIGVGTAGSFSHPATSCRVCPELAAARSRAASRSWAAGPQRSRRCSSATVQDEVPGEPVGVLDRAQPAQQVPPPGLRLVGDALRVEQPHPPARARGAQGGGGGPQVGLVGGGDDRAGRRQHERDRLRGRLPRPGRHERHHRVFPRRVHARPGPPARAQQPAEREPGLGRVHRPGVGAGQGPAQACGGPGYRQPGQGPHPRVAGERRDRVTGSRPQPGSHPRDHGDQGRRAPGQQDSGDGDRHGGGVRPRLPGAPVQDIASEFDAKRFHRATGDPRGEPGRGPDQPGQRDQRPAGDQDRPPGRRPAGRCRRARSQCPAHHEPPSWLSRIAWSVS